MEALTRVGATFRVTVPYEPAVRSISVTVTVTAPLFFCRRGLHPHLAEASAVRSPARLWQQNRPIVFPITWPEDGAVTGSRSGRDGWTIISRDGCQVPAALTHAAP